MATTGRRKKYKFKPNKNTLVFLLVLILFIVFISMIRSCTKYDRSLRGAVYTAEYVSLPEFQVRSCARPDGSPSADYTEVYPPALGDKVLYLTFDDGPSAKVTPQILDILKKYNVKATFFIIAKNAEQNPDLLKRIAEEGHMIANHSYSHELDVIYSDREAFREEVLSARDTLMNIVGPENYADIFRFPGGAFTNQREEFKEVLIEENIPFVNWNCLTGDAETQNPVPAKLLERAKSSANQSGSDALIMLMHDAGAKQATADSLPGLIEHFKNQGYRFDSLKRY